MSPGIRGAVPTELGQALAVKGWGRGATLVPWSSSEVCPHTGSDRGRGHPEWEERSRGRERVLTGPHAVQSQQGEAVCE